jgi:RNase P/RNase MRP subunit POP5
LKRLKRRYLGLRLDVDCLPSKDVFMEAVWGTFTRLYGEVGASLAGLVLIDYDDEKSAILRANLAAVDNVRAALTTLTSIGGKEAAVHVLFVSGTIKALRAKLKK